MLRLRPYKNCDAKYIVSWVKDELTFRRWCADRYENYPITADDMNRHYAACAEADNFYEWTAFDDSGVVGHLIMRFLDEEKKVLRFGFINESAYQCYKAAGFEAVIQEKPEIYHVMGEEWKCIEMEITKGNQM